MTHTRGRAGDPLTTGGALGLGIVLLLVTILTFGLGWCGCTPLALTSWALIGAAVGLLGNRSFGVLAEEKEKKTLDCLRLTQLSASRLFWYKLAPEFRSLARLLAAAAPALLTAAALSPSGLTAAFPVMAIAALSGVMSIVLSLFVSSLAPSTSRAVVQGWTLKGAWLLLTPVLDLVVAAVTVTTTRNPVFDAINPFAAVWPVVVPEAQFGVRAYLPYIFLTVGSAITAAMWWIASNRYEKGLTAAPTLTDRNVHSLYRQTPAWVPNIAGLRDNPVFLRELAAQLRSGAGRWPGYAVFLTLFLAPFLYSQSWSQRRNSEMEWQTTPRLQAAPSAEYAAKTPVSAALPASKSYVRLHSYDGTELHLKGHRECGCLRMGLYNHFRVALPASQVVKVEYRTPYQNYFEPEQTVQNSHGPEEVQLSAIEARSYGVSSRDKDSQFRPLSDETLNQIRAHSINQGLLGCIFLLSLYLSVRCSGFLANAVTSENDRRSWTDLALTGIEPAQVLNGKLAGALIMPLIQLLVVSPALLLFVSADVLSPIGAVQLVTYSIALALTSGLIGLWASSASSNSHSAQGLALVTVLSWLFVAPLFVLGFGTASIAVFIPLALLSLIRPNGIKSASAWLGLTTVALLSAKGLTPWTALPTALLQAPACSTYTCPLTGMATYLAGMLALACISALAYNQTLTNLQQPGQTDTLRADRA